MNGQVFAGLNNLQDVLLTGNECINEKFQKYVDEEKLATLIEVVNVKCGYFENIDENAKSQDVGL